jgi:hypothetical protein
MLTRWDDSSLDEDSTLGAGPEPGLADSAAEHGLRERCRLRR